MEFIAEGSSQKTQSSDWLVLKLLANHNWRGVPLPDVIAAFQDARDKVGILTNFPDFCPELIPFIPSDFKGTREDYIAQETYYWNCVADGILFELKRRRGLKYDLSQKPDREVLQAIKDRVPIADVLEWYCDVIYSGKTQWKFRCRLHGDGVDTEPSGVVYSNEKRWWCYGCNRGGDIYDAVVIYGKVDLPQAIQKLARYVGYDTTPIFKKPQLRVRGGAEL